VFLLPAIWAHGLAGRRDTWTGWAGAGTGEHEEAQKSFGIHPQPQPKEENEAAKKRANEHTWASERNISCLHSSTASLSNKQKVGATNL